MIYVAGNNDWGIDLPRYAKIQIEDLKILITHGQYYGYFSRQQLMEVDLKKHGCQALFSGHTHIPDFSEKDGFYFFEFRLHDVAAWRVSLLLCGRNDRRQSYGCRI